MAPPSNRRSRSGGRGGVPSLPLDALCEILLRLTAKELCRLRAVYQPWRALLSDPQFIAAHAARHPGPLIVAGYGVRSGFPDGDILCDVMDLSGQVVKRIRAPGNAIGKVSVVSAQLDLVQFEAALNGSSRLLDPATGAVSALPEELSDEHAKQLGILVYMPRVVLGKVATTGEYKALRILDPFFVPSSELLCEVFTIGGSGDDARWRAKKAPSDPVDVWADSRRAVVNGIVYFFVKEVFVYQGVLPKRITSFDLGTEEWGTTVQGPPIEFMENAFGPLNNNIHNQLSLAALNDCLAVVHFMRGFSMELWYLMDSEKGIWVKQHSIKFQPYFQDEEFDVCPILVLNDGRIVTYTGAMGLLRIYNPRTATYTNLADFRPYSTIGLYTGNLLSLANGVRLF